MRGKTMQITIENQTFTVTEDSERLTITDTKDNVIGVANDMQGATAICEQIAWRRKVDGKVNGSQKAVDDSIYRTQPIIECELCKHNSIRLVIVDYGSAFLKRVCTLNVRYDGKSHCESFAMKENE